MGKQVADYYQNLAVQLCSGKDEMFARKELIIEEYRTAGKKSEINNALQELYKEYKENTPNLPKDLCYLEDKYRDMYLHDMDICQKYASINRLSIALQILDKIMPKNYTFAFNNWETIHNYIDIETGIVRKGAISAKEGEQLLIPINMRDGCIIGYGLGNDDWNQSAPHGAGRFMSRTKAFATYKLEEFQKSMEGIYSTSIQEDTIDEAPFVYKPIEEILNNIGDTVKVLKIIKPIYNFKYSREVNK
jgi:RNA-splicing ligase RtcB